MITDFILLWILVGLCAYVLGSISDSLLHRKEYEWDSMVVFFSMVCGFFTAVVYAISLVWGIIYLWKDKK